MDFPTTRVFDKLAEAYSRYRILVMVGSGRSGKTYSILQWIIIQCFNTKTPLKVAIVRAKLTWLKATVLVDFKDILVNQLGIWDEQCFNKSEMTYNLNGSIISFLGLDSDAGKQKAHGMKTDLLYFNECAELDYEPVRQLILRNVGKVILDLNPCVGVDFWLYEKILGGRKDALEIHSTYKDNWFCPQEFITEIELSEPTEENIKNGTADETHWKIYGLGQRALVKGLVFPVFETVAELPMDLKNCAYGMDFGFANDFTTLTFKGELDGCLFIDEMLYKRGLVNLESKYNEKQASIEAELKKLNINKRFTIWADSAEPKSIQDLKNAGFNIDAVKKGAGSILDGINTIKRFKLRVTERSMNLIKELRNYKWVENRDGSPTNIPVDNFNHCIAKGTLITTHKGDIPIENVIIGDYVLTRKGYRKVLKAWCSGKNQYVSRIITDNGLTLDATNNHKIYTCENDFIELENININNTLLIIKRDNNICFTMNQMLQILLFLMEKYTNEIQSRIKEITEYTIELQMISRCIEIFGYSLMVLYLKVITYIIKILIHLITTYQILNVFHAKSIDYCIVKIKNIFQLILNTCVKNIENGMSQKMVMQNIVNMPESRIKIENTKNIHVDIVDVNIPQNIDIAQMDFAQINVIEDGVDKKDLITKLEHALNVVRNLPLEKIIKQNTAHVIAVKNNIYKTDVYDLSIEDEHEFFANGILVHNCLDGLRYSCYMTELNNGFGSSPFKVDPCGRSVKGYYGCNKYDITRGSSSAIDEEEFDDGYRY